MDTRTRAHTASVSLFALATFSAVLISACAVRPGPPVVSPAGTPAGEGGQKTPANASPTPTLPTPTPDTESVIYYVTAHNYMARGNYVEAERRFSIVIEMEPEFARGWDGRAYARMLQGDFGDAAEDLDRAIQLKPDLAQAYSHRAVTRLALGDPLGANEDALKALTLDPEDPEAHVALGRLLGVAGLYDEALVHFDAAVKLAPDEGGAYWWRGRFLRDTGEFQAAMSDFDMAIDMDPTEASFYLDRAITRINFHDDKDAARADLEEAISLAQDPKRPDIVDVAEQLLESLETE